MKIVKSYAWLRVEITRKFLLLSITAGLALGSCNIYPGFFNWMFGLGSKKVVEQTFTKDLKSFVSESFEILKTPLMIAMIAVPAYYLINFLFKKKPDAPVNTGGQNMPPAPEVGPVDKEDEKETDSVDISWKTLPSLPKLEVEVEGSVKRNSVQDRDDNVVELARLNDILMEGEIKFDVALENGQSAINTVRQLRVDRQGDLSCGPRALYNVNVVSQVFDNNNGVFTNDINLLADLNTLPGLHENPKLRQFFIEMRNLQGIAWRTICPEFIKKKVTEEKDGNKIEKTVDIKNSDPRAGFKDPQNLQGGQLEAFLEHCKPENNKSVKIKNTDIMDGYSECFDEVFGNRINDLMEHENLVGILNAQEIGYFHSYVINNGQHERRDIGHNSGGHWISLFVIKTGDNEYSWYVLDSMNGSHVNDRRIKAYIYKLLGSVYQDYETKVINPAKDRLAKAEDDKSFNQIKKRFNILKILNTNLNENDNQIYISREFKDCVNRLNTSTTINPFKDNFLKYIDEQIKEIDRLTLIDQQDRKNLIDEIKKFGASDRISKIEASIEDGFVTLADEEVKQKKRLGESIRNAMFNLFDLAVDVSEMNKQNEEKQEKEKQNKEKQVFDKIKASVKTFLDKNKEAKIRSDIKVPGELASEIRETLKISKDTKLNFSYLNKWVDDKNKFVNGDLKIISKKDKENFVSDIKEFRRILEIK